MTNKSGYVYVDVRYLIYGVHSLYENLFIGFWWIDIVKAIILRKKKSRIFNWVIHLAK